MTEEYERCRKCGKLVRVIRRKGRRILIEPKDVWAVPDDGPVTETFVREDGTKMKGYDPDLGPDTVGAEKVYRMHGGPCGGKA